jgi:hypothetical protein
MFVSRLHGDLPHDELLEIDEAGMIGHPSAVLFEARSY